MEIPGSVAEQVLLEARIRELAERCIASPVTPQTVPPLGPETTTTLLSHELHETYNEMVRYRNLYLAAEDRNRMLVKEVAECKDITLALSRRLAILERMGQEVRVCSVVDVVPQ